MTPRAWVPPIVCLLALASPSTVAGQAFSDAHDWCVQHHPCDWAGHAAATGITSGLIGAATGIDSRWFAAGWSLFFIRKEIRDGARWGWQGKDASKIAPLPRPLDAAIDLAVTAVSAIWLAPALERWIVGDAPTGTTDRGPDGPLPDVPLGRPLVLQATPLLAPPALPNCAESLGQTVLAGPRSCGIMHPDAWTESRQRRVGPPFR